MEYKEFLLKDLALKIGDGLHGTPSYDPKGDFYFVNGNNLEEGNIVIKDTTKTVNRETFEKYKKDLSKRTLLVSINGTIGKIAKFNNENIVLGKSACYINLNDTADKNYIYFLLKSREFQNYIQQYATGTTIKNVSLKTIRNFKVKLPALKYQNKVSTILQNIENKIQLNYKMIANLQELSQTLFKRWFVDFEFPDENGNPYKSSGGEMVDSELGEIPKGWNVKNLDDIANYVNGLAMQKFKPTDNENSLPVVKIKELKNGSTDENSNRCTSEIPDKALINDGDIIFSWSATLLVKMWCGGKAGLNQHLFKVSSDKYPKWFYYYWTKRYIDYFIGIANDKATTMGHINRKHLSHAKILIPNDSTLEKFSRTFDDLLEKELSVSKEIKRLIELRDTLLPKLMSGEIEIPDDIEVNEDELSI
ncbi:restriction endonuclease subunit S [Staphylococcus sp. 11261D007BR]